MKKTNTIITTMMAFCLLATPLWAAESASAAKSAVSKNKSVTLPSVVQESFDHVIQLFPKLKNYEIKDIRETKIEDDIQGYKIFMSKGNEKKDQATIVISETGEVVEVGVRADIKDSNQQISEAKSREKATDFMDELLGGESRNYQIGQVYVGKGTANVIFYKLVNDIPFLNDGYSIGVGGDGKIIHVYKNTFGHGYSGNDFPDPSRAISAEQAKRALPQELRNSSLQLVYKLDKSGEPQLFYITSDRLTYAQIDAVTGKLVSGGIDEDDDDDND